MPTRSEIHQQVDDLQATERDLGSFEQRFVRVERRAANRGRKIRGGLQRGVKYVGKHRKKLKKKPGRTVAGMAGRGAVALSVGAVHTAGYAAKKAGQGYRKARPHVAGASRRAGQNAYAYATVYGGPVGAKAAEHGGKAAASTRRASRQAKSRANRLNARLRTQRRRVAGQMHTRAELYRSQGKNKLAQVVETAATGISPKRRIEVRCACGATFHNRARAAQHVCHDAIKAENAAIDRARQWQPVAGPTAGHTPPRTTTAPTPSGGTTMASNTSRKAGATPTGGFEPADYEEWMNFLHGKAAYHKQEADGLQELAERMDNEAGMDPRSLLPLYMGAEAQQVVAKGFVDSYAKFWQLYQDRLEQQGDTGRRMNREDKFFGQAK